jgi:hypothetical protein
MDVRLYFIAGTITLALLILLTNSIQEHRRLQRGCASEGMTLVESRDGYRCRDDRGDLFLPPFKPEKHR